MARQNTNPTNPKDASGTQETNIKHVTPAAVPQATASPQSSDPCRKKDKADPEPKPWLTHGEWINSGLTLIYILVSIAAFFAIKRQADLTEKQGESSTKQFTDQLAAMEQSRQQTDKLIAQARAQAVALQTAAEAAIASAEATKASTDNLITAEEAILIAEIRRDTSSAQLGYSLEVTNFGRTPAEIFGITIGYSLLSADVQQVKTDSHPERIIEIDEYPAVIGGGQTKTMKSGIKITDYIKSGWEDISNLKKNGIFYGRILYITAFTNDISTYFCYFVSSSDASLVRINRPGLGGWIIPVPHRRSPPTKTAQRKKGCITLPRPIQHGLTKIFGQTGYFLGRRAFLGKAAAIYKTITYQVGDLGVLAQCQALPAEHPLRKTATALGGGAGGSHQRAG
jgi:hypothetical protein